MKKILLALGAVVIIAAAARSFWAYQQMNKQVPVTLTSDGSVATASTIDKAANRVVNKNDRYGLSGYTFLYPKKDDVLIANGSYSIKWTPCIDNKIHPDSFLSIKSGDIGGVLQSVASSTCDMASNSQTLGWLASKESLGFSFQSEAFQFSLVDDDTSSGYDVFAPFASSSIFYIRM